MNMAGAYVCHVRLLSHFALSSSSKKLTHGPTSRFDESYATFVFTLTFSLTFTSLKLVFGSVVKKAFVIFLIFFETSYVNIGGGTGEGVYTPS